MSAKSSIKALVPADQSSALFRWVALLTGSKNALKGVGFFLGGLLLSALGYRAALFAMAASLVLVFVSSAMSLPREIGKAKKKPKLKGLLSPSRDVNVLSAARFFLFGARDIWFVVGVPVFLAVNLDWTFTEVGSFLALWVIGYGVVQAGAPALIRRWTNGHAPQGSVAWGLAFALAGVTALVALGLKVHLSPTLVIVVGLGIFGVVFALNSSVHSYLILAYSDGDKVAMNVGFYYMANAAGRLVGTLLSGLMFELAGVTGCLSASAAFAFAAGVVALKLPELDAPIDMRATKIEGSE